MNETIALAAVHFFGSDPFRRLATRLPAELQQVAPKRRNEFLAGRYCASRALVMAGYTSLIWPARNDDGLPIWPPGWIGSISHTTDGAIAAVARSESCHVLGVDMERLIAPAHFDEIRTLVVQPGELELLVDLSPAQALTLLFSAKEALYKALYPQVRQFFDFSAARAIQWHDRNLSLLLTKSWSVDWPQGTRVPVAHAFEGNHVYTTVWQPSIDPKSGCG